MERAIEFLLNHHAKVSAHIEQHSEQIERHSEQIERHSEQIERHSEQIERHSEQIERHSEQISQLTEDVQVMRVELRDAINNLIIANEVTRNLAEQIAQLTIQNSQRITKIEEKAS
jgi:ABC-type transporter Mla subunit MlaD